MLKKNITSEDNQAETNGIETITSNLQKLLSNNELKKHLNKTDLNNMTRMLEKLNKNIEGFRNNDENMELLVFLTKTCPYCVKYDNQIHKNLENKLKNRCKIRKIYADNDKDKLFEKYDIQYVPKGLLLSNERYVPIEGALDNETICKYLDKINN